MSWTRKEMGKYLRDGVKVVVWYKLHDGGSTSISGFLLDESLLGYKLPANMCHLEDLNFHELKYELRFSIPLKDIVDVIPTKKRKNPSYI